MKNKISDIMPVILLLFFVFVGSVVLPKKNQTIENTTKTDKISDFNREEIKQQSLGKPQDTKDNYSFEKTFPLVVIDASHSPFLTESEDIQEETEGEKLYKAGQDIYEYEATYELANAISDELKSSNIKIIVLQERTKEKIHLIEQIVPNMVIVLHVHKTLEGKEVIYYKRNSKGKEIVQEMFSRSIIIFKLKEKKQKKEAY